MLTTIFRFDLNNFWVMGCWGWGGGFQPRHDRLTTDQDRPGKDALVFLQLNTYLMMLEYSYSYETYRICLQYLDSLGGGGCGADPVTTDSRLTKSDQGRRTLLAIKYILNDVRIFRQL